MVLWKWIRKSNSNLMLISNNFIGLSAVTGTQYLLALGGRESIHFQ